MVWLLLAVLTFIIAIGLMTIRMPLRMKFMATLVGITLIGVAVDFAVLGTEAFVPTDRNGMSLPACSTFCALGLAPIAALGDYQTRKRARAAIRQGQLEGLPSWLQKWSRYLFDVED